MPEFQKFLPTGWTESPSTPVEALKAGKAVLEDEQRWIKGHWFQNYSPDTNPDDAYCNHWQVCAAGAIGIVTIGSVRYKDDEQAPIGRKRGQWFFDSDVWQYDADMELYETSLNLLLAAVPEVEPHPECGDSDCDQCCLVGGEWDEVPAFNDDDYTTHDHVMAAFDKAIASAEALVAS